MSRTDFLYVHPLQFQRGDRNIPIKKHKKKLAVRVRHIVVSLAGVALLFFAFYKLYLFLITWDNLNIRSVEVVCPNKQVEGHLIDLVRSAAWGNIFLLDISRVQKNLAAYPWVKTIQVRKIFPSSLKIEVAARTPAAMLKKTGVELIDEEGVVLEQTDTAAHPDLPLFLDTGLFAQDAREKLQTAWNCLNSLSPEEKSSVETLDLSDLTGMVLVMRGSSTAVYLGADDFSRKVAFYRDHKDGWEREHGALEYVDLRFPDRIYFKTVKAPAEADAVPNPVKEAP